MNTVNTHKPFGNHKTWAAAIEPLLEMLDFGSTEKRGFAISEMIRCAELADHSTQMKGFTILYKFVDKKGEERTSYNGFFSNSADAVELFQQALPAADNPSIHEPRLCMVGDALGGYPRVKPDTELSE